MAIDSSGIIGLLSHLSGNIALEIGLVIILATLLSFIVKLFKQPLIPAYVIAGLILGPIGLGIIKDPIAIRALSELGISFLLFVVGLEISLNKLKYVGPAAVLGGILQIVGIYFIGLYAALTLGFTFFEAIILGLVLTFSSTMVVIKLLSDSEQIDTLHGRIVLGILLIQDLAVFIAIPLLATFNNFSLYFVFIIILKLLGLLLVAALLGKYIFPQIFRFAAKSGELLFMSSVTALFLFTLLAHLLEFSLAIGAFLAGLTLANLPYHYDVKGKITPLKSFFATLFFVSLGMQLTPINFSLFYKILILFLIVILVKPMVLYFLTRMFGYEKRTAFLTGISLAQISEFSLIIISLPFVFGLLSPETFSLIIFLAIVTMVLTSYLLEFQDKIYTLNLPLLKLIDRFFPRKPKHDLGYQAKGQEISTILIGVHRMGRVFLENLVKSRKKIIAIDNNPEIIKSLINRKISCIYGDARSREVLDQLKLGKIRTVVSTIPNLEENLFLIDYMKSKNSKINIFVTAGHIHQAKRMYRAGADYVIMPHTLTGEKVSHNIVKSFRSKSYLRNLRKNHFRSLEKDPNSFHK